MIPVIKLAKSLRYALKDMQGVSYSDFEIIEVINQAASLLYSRMSEQFVLSGIKRKIVTVDTERSIALPNDFIRIHQVGMGENDVAIPVTYTPTVEGTYRIVDGKFHAPEGAYTLEYYYTPSMVKSFNDELDVPSSLSPYVEQIALALSGNNFEKAMEVANLCSNTLKAREQSHFVNVSPTQVLGGKV